MFNFTRVLLLLGYIVSAVIAAPSVTTTFSNTIQYQFDTNGNAIDLTSTLKPVYIPRTFLQKECFHYLISIYIAGFSYSFPTLTPIADL